MVAFSAPSLDQRAQHDENARQFVKSCLAGEVSTIWVGECGVWQPYIEDAQQVFAREPEQERKGPAVWLRLCQLVATGKYDPLAKLLNIPDKLTQDNNARSYLEAFQAGQKPKNRPDCGRHEAAVKVVDNAYSRMEDRKDRGLMCQKLLESMVKSKQYPGLKELLAGQPIPGNQARAEQGGSEDQDPPGMPPLPEEARLPPAVAALAKDACPWFDQAVQYGQCASPEGYHGFFEAGAVFVLATVAANRLVIPGGPNGGHTGFYFALVARPGCWAKTTTAQTYLNMLRSADLSSLLWSDQLTPQKLVANMAGRTPPTNYFQLSPELQTWWKARLAQAGQGGIYRDELGAFFRAMNRPNSPYADFRQHLLSFDERLPSYANETRAWGTEKIELPYLTVLGATTFADFRVIGKAGSDEHNDGMLARFTLITPPPGPALNKPFDFETVAVPTSLSIALHKMHEWLSYPIIDIVEEQDEKGKESKLVINVVKERPPAREIKPEREAAASYHRYRSALRTLQGVPEDLASSYVRLPVKALRVAALFAGIECSSTITLGHWAKAQELTERWRMSLHQFYQQINTPEDSLANKLEAGLLDFLDKHIDQKYSLSEILQNATFAKRYKAKARDLQEILLRLDRDGIICCDSVERKQGRKTACYSKAGGR